MYAFAINGEKTDDMDATPIYSGER